MLPSQSNKTTVLKSWHTVWVGMMALGAAMVLGAGCSRQYYKRSADREVYGIVQAKSSQVPGMLEEFSVEKPEGALQRTELLANPSGGAEPEQAQQEAAPDTEASAEPLVISLAKALEIASLNSRQYQTQKEELYRRALTLTAKRYLFDPRFFGKLSGEYKSVDSGTTDQVTGKTDFGFRWLLSTGANLSVSLASTFREILTRGPQKTAGSVFRATITQPLLKGAGIAVDEPLTQAERDVRYQMRTFVRFRRTFFVSVLSEYYRVLQQRQILDNQRLNYENLRKGRERAEAMGDAGKWAQFQVDEFRQSELSAENSVETQGQRYQNALDRFKVTLGLPTEADLVLEPKELDLLIAEGAVEIGLDDQAAREIAIENRLDLMSKRDQVEDAERKVEVAGNDLLPGLDLSATLETDTERPKEPLDFHLHRTDLTAGFELDLPLDRLTERNEYRRKLIALEKARRDNEELRDQVVLQVRRALREYTRAESSYQIQKNSLALAKVRVESTMMLMQAGRTSADRVLDAQASLVRSQNDVTTALVDYKVASLEFARDMGILVVDEKGQLEESFDEYQ